jgi:hypothetical protein
VVIVRCPTGCGTTRRPHARRTEPVRCANCRAWFVAAAAVEDGALVDGVLLARPGDPLATGSRSRAPALIGAALAGLAAVAAAWLLLAS